MKYEEQPIKFIDNTALYPVLTKREYFAAMAMQELSANADWPKTMRHLDDWDNYKERLCRASIELADELSKQLES